MKKLQKKTIQVGELISATYAKELTSGYELFTGSDSPSFELKKDLVFNLLNQSRVAGIRFMYGLQDPMNPYTLRLIMVPCTNEGDFGMPMPLLSTSNYFDHEGQILSIVEASNEIANFVNYFGAFDPTWNYHEVTRGSFFGSETLKQLLNKEECSSMRYTLGFGIQDEEVHAHIHPVLEPIDLFGINSWSDLLENGLPCPPYCKGGGYLENSVSKNMNIFSEFKHIDLLKTQGGKQAYELYYFVTPLLNSIIVQQEMNTVEFYESKFNEVIELIRLGHHNEAVSEMSKTLNELIETYHFTYA